jgi:succinoglycan biosynthesis protein ExoM
MGDGPAPGTARIIVVACTYRRNEPLARLLDALAGISASLVQRARVGVVIVDDNPGGDARDIVEQASPRFPLGTTYRHLGRGNISLGRNLCLETALAVLAADPEAPPGGAPGASDWIAMTDDDCLPGPGWLSAYLDATEAAPDTDVFTGPCVITAPPGAPGWLVEQPFLNDADIRGADLELMDLAATNNSLMRALVIASRADVRFLERLGVVGGEDMVFFGTLHRAGVRMRFVTGAVVEGIESPDRATRSYVLRARWWLGNTEGVTNLEMGSVTRTRLILRGLAAIARAAVRPLRMLSRRRSPQLLYALGSSLRGAGMIAAAAGHRVRHH